MSDEAPQTPTPPSPETVGRSIMSGFQVIAAALEHLATTGAGPSAFLQGLVQQLRGHADTVAASLPQPEPAPQEAPAAEPEVTSEGSGSEPPATNVTSGGWSQP